VSEQKGRSGPKSLMHYPINRDIPSPKKFP
jgi:hypothetical protein